MLDYRIICLGGDLRASPLPELVLFSVGGIPWRCGGGEGADSPSADVSHQSRHIPNWWVGTRPEHS